MSFKMQVGISKWLWGFSEAGKEITSYITGYYSETKHHQYGVALTPSDLECLYWNDSKIMVDLTL